ncbi:GEVED domain-containing protein [Stieleria varia]|uniref:GEVED domain-containing protein n=1 Tax=Stieleria varia TaxID=2528005 RepID=A0A5C6ALG0_9BACT|nr:GEVED domain-containing protein [Stieleria varia]TWU00863.1 hypothetical protein Pla52n_42320 [Stieleria varia]
MTLRKPSPSRKRLFAQGTARRVSQDRLRRSRLEKRRSLVENLETRQLLAGPELVGVQPNEGALLNDGTVLNVTPRELVFQFDDNSILDPDTLSAIRITRAGEDGVFESASASSDVGTGGAALVEFRAIQTGSLGNGITVNFESSFRQNSSVPVVTVNGRTVTISVNSNTQRPSTVGGLISAVANHPEASGLIEVIQVSGAGLTQISAAQVAGESLVLSGANAAQAVTDFGSNGAVRARFVSQIPGEDGRGIELRFEQRNFGATANPVIVVTDQVIRIQLNSFAADPTNVRDLIDAINNNPQASLLVEASLQEGDETFGIGALSTAYSPLTLSGVSDVVVTPGFVGLGDTAREVIFRFKEPLPDDIYQIDILGTGQFALRNEAGEAFQDGTDLTRRFLINLGTQVAAVVPEPIRRNPDGTLSPETGKIEVHFNDDELNATLAQDPSFYQLIFTNDTADNTDDTIIRPTSVVYSNITNIATLNFSRPLSRIPDPNDTNVPPRFLPGAARLRIGTRENLPARPTEVNLVLNQNNVVEPGDSFGTAFNLNSQWSTSNATTTRSARLTSEIVNRTSYGLDLPGPNVDGVREIRPEDIGRLDRTVPLDYVRGGPDTIDGISVIQYDFAPSYLGDDPSRPGIVNDTTYFNIISEEQKVRVREAIQLFSEYLGVTFVEVDGEPTSDAYFTFSVGDLYGGDPGAFSGDGGVAVVTGDRDGDGIDDLAVMDFQDFDESIDDQFGGEFFRGAMFAVGQLLGYGYANDLPQPVTQSTNFIFTPGTDNEPAYPSIADILHGQYLYRPESLDIDMYRFTVDTAGELNVETIAERLGSPSLLDSHLRLYRADGTGSFVELAQNDDYFSNDSLIRIRVQPGEYMIGVSAKGNDEYDPTIPGTGFGGLSEGAYELRVEFTPDTADFITDTTGVPLDGDSDGRPGGDFDFWFVPADPNNTLYVDKAAVSVPGGLIGTVGNPYREIDQAIAAAQPGDTIRVVGNGGLDGKLETPADNFSYQIGFTNNALPLADGTTLDLPQGVHMVIDSGAVLKFNRARVGVGSVSPLIDLSDSSLQVLGTPSIVSNNGLPIRDAANAIIPGSVYFTSINDDTVGAGNVSQFTPAPRPGDWGGIDFRGDLDTADELRRNRENEAVFLNHLQYADMRYGGGAVSIGGQQVVISPVEMSITRPTIINTDIRNSADAAMAATPDTFAETRFTDNQFQSVSPFTPDYTRIGPEIHGNTVIDNSINGLFIRLSTRSGQSLETVSKNARFDDTDIAHVLTENLVIDGSPGGPIIQSDAPSSFLIRTTPTTNGNVAPGTYVYRLTNVSSDGLESAASQPTVTATLTSTGAIQLTQLPAVAQNSGFVSRRLYRALVDPATQLPGEYRLVSQLNASSTSFVDRVAIGTLLLNDNANVLRSRLDASLVIDPGTVLKIDGARIEARFGANFKAEGSPSLPIVITGLEDQRYGGSGTFDTNDRGEFGEINPGDWGGLYIGQGASASLDNAVIAGGGGTTRVEGGFAAFNAIEVHQADLRLTNSRLEQNGSGRFADGTQNGTRVGRDDNAPGTVFVRASQPIIVDNDFLTGTAEALSFDVNSLSLGEVVDHGRSIGQIDLFEVSGNSGPLIQENTMTGNAINGMTVRGGQLTTEGVWDDVDVVHVVTETIEVPNQHIYGGLRLESDARGSLVVKFLSGDEPASIVVGGNLLGSGDQLRDIPDRIGGSLQIMGHADFPVVLTTLADDASGAGFDINGRPQLDTNNDGLQDAGIESQQTGGGFIRLPTGPEVNNGTTIDNDVDPNTPGFFEATVGDGNELGIGDSDVTVTDSVTGQALLAQDLIFSYNTFITANGATLPLSGTNITQAATLIADDVVESRGFFQGANGSVTWIATSTFMDGVPILFTSLEFGVPVGGNGLGDIQVASYLDEDVNLPNDDLMFITGTPGAADFRVFTIDGVEGIGFSQGGYYTNDGVNQINATYLGWAADQFNDLQTAILAGNQAFSVPGTIDLVDLPATADPIFGTIWGPNDVTTALAWSVDPDATTARVTSFLELIAEDPTSTPAGSEIASGLWEGVIIREGADDRNVAAFTETEPVRTTVFDSNSIPSQSQFLGELAPREQAGDENRRLGFVVDGTISTRTDVDVYSFIAESGTEVWFDIDGTAQSLDSVIELVDANGLVLAASNDSILAETNSAAIYSDSRIDPDAARPLSVVEQRVVTQRLTISESIVDATGGNLTISIDGAEPEDAVLIPVSVFLADPAEAIERALDSFAQELGVVNVTLQRRIERTYGPNGTTVLAAGGAFVLDVRFDDRFFVGRQPADIQLSSVGVFGTTVTTSTTAVLLNSQLQDVYSTNAKDAGMRVRLPGETGTRNLYHIRVRSSNTANPLDFNTLVFGDPANDIEIFDGLTKGSYQLQVRLREADESAGTQVKLADIRYATNGLQIIGQPFHSPLTGEEYETSQTNDLLADAQALGYFGTADDATSLDVGPLQSDRLAKSIAGVIDSSTDVDWYRFEIRYDDVVDSPEYFSTVFDLDYASNFARSNVALHVFNAAGELIFTGDDSNIADDLPSDAASNETGDLGRGSAGTEDPYIGTVELREGTYFMAISNASQLPQPLDQYFNRNSANPLLRLEPIQALNRIASQDDFSDGQILPPSVETVLFDSSSIEQYSFDDVLLYVNTGSDLFIVNPFTGESYGRVGSFQDEINDIAFRSNGELFGYTDYFQSPPGDNQWSYARIGTGDALVTEISVGGGIQTRHDTVGDIDIILDNFSDDGLSVEAIAIREFQGSEDGFLVGNRPIDRTGAIGGLEYYQNILYEFDEVTGDIIGPTYDLDERFAGAGTTRREIGQINTVAPPTAAARQLGISDATEVNINGLATATIVDGDAFTLDDGTNTFTFEFDQGFTLTANGGTILDEDSIVINNAFVFEFNVGAAISIDEAFPGGNLQSGDTLSITGSNSVVTTFQFLGEGDTAAVGNIGVRIEDQLQTPLPAATIAANLVGLINTNVADADAILNGTTIEFGELVGQIGSTGLGVTVLGNNGISNSNAIGVQIGRTTDPEVIIDALAEAMRSVGVVVSAAGNQLSLPERAGLVGSTSAAEFSAGITLSGAPGVATDNIRIGLLPTDSAAVIAQRISDAVDAATGGNITATPQGRSLQIVGADIVGTTANLTAGGVPTGGFVRGVEIINDQLYALTDTGGLFRVSTQELNTNGNRQVGTYVARSTDLVGINFSGLRAGPTSIDGAAYRDLLFGTTSSGEIYAFNTFGELQPVFAGGRSSISTGIGGTLGLDFSTLDYSLWHTTGRRGGDPGHTGGPTNSIAFNYEGSAFSGNYASNAEQPVRLNPNGVVINPRLDGEGVFGTYNFPGGAKGVLNSNEFSLEDYAAADEPVLYFNYFLNTDGVDSEPFDQDLFAEDQDNLRVYVVQSDGTAHLLASNNAARGLGLGDDEFDDPIPQADGTYLDDVDIKVQQLFDNTGTWRQARVELGDFAGQKGLTLRVEYSTGGTTQTTSPTLRAVSPDNLIDGAAFVVGGQRFEVDLAPSISLPSGSQLRAAYDAVAIPATFTIDGQTYVLNDGTFVVGPNEISVDLLPQIGATPADLSALTAADIATIVEATVRGNLPPAAVIGQLGVDFIDLPASSGTNDFIYEATPLNYPGGDAIISGNGQLEGFPGTGFSDVDLYRLNVTRGTVIQVDTDFDGNPVLGPLVRFFDEEGNVLASVDDTIRDVSEFTATFDGPVLVGLSARNNDDYDPRFLGTRAVGVTLGYSLVVNVDTPDAVTRQENLVEFFGSSVVTVGQPGLPTDPALLLVEGTRPISGVGVPISIGMTTQEVAVEIQRAIANRFTDGKLSDIPQIGLSVRLPDLTLDDAGIFADESDRYGDQFGGGVLAGARDNNSEGVFLDDFIIGFAERGEMATGSNVVSGAFISNDNPLTPVPNDPVSSLQTGTYQVEIRDASEYYDTSIVPVLVPPDQFRTFDTNERLVAGRTIVANSAANLQDGLTFSINDGRSEVEFEFDLVESNTGITPGRVGIPYTMLQVRPGTEQLDFEGTPIPGTAIIEAQSATDVARAIADAINRSDVRAVLDVRALLNSGVDAVTDARVNLFGNVVVVDQQQSLAAVEETRLRGDENRQRDSQGIILVENTRFLFNETYGVNINQNLTANVAGQVTSTALRYPRNLVELNVDSLKPGVVIQSNVFAYNGVGGLQIEGIDPAANETLSDPVSYERVVNNTFVGGTITPGTESPSETFNGVLFDQGILSFADRVVSYQPNADGSPPTAIHQTPNSALGAPDSNNRGAEPVDGQFAVSLGLGGTLTLEFTDNLLTGSGDSQADLIVFETGTIESVLVEISRDGVSFFDVGILGGLTNQLDIDAFGFGPEDRFAFVRLTDLRQDQLSPGAAAGADIDAVGALSSVPVDRYVAGGVGINVTGNAAPTLMNNVIANSETAVQLEPGTVGTVLGANTYYRNTANVAGAALGNFSEIVNPSEALFASATESVFVPAAGSSIIDSSIDSLPERFSLTTVRNPLNIPPSPVLAPRFDVNGQLRVDDPLVEPPSGLGERVFKDRGASDRGDLTGPRVTLLQPYAPGIGLGAGLATVLGAAPQAFEIQLVDGIAPADVTPGTGVDDNTVTSSSLVVFKDTIPLVEGVDYRFGYNPSTNTIRLTPIAGVWEPDSTYTIRMVDSTDAIVAAVDGVDYTDADRLIIRDSNGDSTSFEYETGIIIDVSTTLVGDVADGNTITVFDGSVERVFELDSNSNFSAQNTQVVIDPSANATQIAQALAAAINADVTLDFIATASQGRVQLTPSIAAPIAITSIPSGTLFNGNDAADGYTVTLFDGSSKRTFELDSNNSTTGTNVRVPVPPFASQAVLAQTLVNAINAEPGFDLAASIAGNRIQLAAPPAIDIGSLPAGTLSNGNDRADGYTITLFDGSVQRTFEFDSNNLASGSNVRVAVSPSATAAQLADALAEAINADPTFRLTADVLGGRIVLSGPTVLSTVTSSTGFINVVGEIGTRTGFGILVPALLNLPDPAVVDGQTFVVSRGAVTVRTFELDNDGFLTSLDPNVIPVTIPLVPTLDDIADAIVRAVGGSGLGLVPENAGFGRVFLGGDINYSVDLSNSALIELGVPGEEPTVPINVPIDQDAEQIVQIISDAIDTAALPGVNTSIFDVRVFLEGTTGVSGVGAVEVITIRDEVGNELQSNQVNGRTELTIFIGTGMDYGDAPAPYASLAANNGPRHAIDNTFSLGVTVDPDPDAQLPNVDEDDGVVLPSVFQAGFTSTVDILINNQNGRTFYLDVWFDWDQDGVFEESERTGFGSADTGRTPLFVLPLSSQGEIVVPPSAVNGETYARFRLSQVAGMGPTGDVPVGAPAFGEIEDYRVFVSNNPYQNPTNQFDVNNSGATTPLDALQIINALAEYGDRSIPLSGSNVPTFLPPFPDVNGNAVVTANDALEVLNELRRLRQAGQLNNELVGDGYVQAAPGVMASGLTALGDRLISDAVKQQEAKTEESVQEVATLPAETVSKTSVFDSPASMQLDSLVDTLAEDAASRDESGSDDENGALDAFFAQL